MLVLKGLRTDAKLEITGRKTGIKTKATRANGVLDECDIGELDKASMYLWLKQFGGNNKLAENLVGNLLGHGDFHK